MNMLSLVYGPRGNAKVKRARRGSEKNWNRYNEPWKKFLGGHYDKHFWLEYREKKFAEIKEKD